MIEKLFELFPKVPASCRQTCAGLLFLQSSDISLRKKLTQVNFVPANVKRSYHALVFVTSIGRNHLLHSTEPSEG
jgi:hypothetical protein